MLTVGDTLPAIKVPVQQGTAALPAGDSARQILSTAADNHASAALAHVASGDYAGEHWLASFAVFLLSN